MEELVKKVNKLEKKIDELEKKIDELIKICGRMDNHVDFVERVYESLKSPLTYISNKFNRSNYLY